MTFKGAHWDRFASAVGRLALLLGGLFCLPPPLAAGSGPQPAADFPIVIQEVRTDGSRRHPQLKILATAPADKAAGSSWKAETGPVQISTHTLEAEFVFAPRAVANHRAIRLRYRLEGYETEWHESAGPMRVVARCRDKNGMPINGGEFAATDDSPGWTGDPETSPFIERKFTVRVPPRGMDLRLWVVSGGNANVTGALIVDDLKITRLPEKPSEPGEVLLSEDFEQGLDLNQPTGNFTDWARSGTLVGIAQVAMIDRKLANHALALIDADPKSFGEWQTQGSRLVPVKPGWNLLVQFKEMHSVGGVDRVRAKYEDLPPGKYRFRVVEVSEYGLPQGVEASVPVTVVPPVYETGWFRSIVLLVTGGVLAGVIRYGAIRRLKLQLRFERAREQDRARIARDIHDELGTSLTRISFLSEAAKKQSPARAMDAATLDQIHETAQEMTRALDEIVWTVDPAKDSLESLANYIASMAQDTLGLAGIRCRLKLPIPVPQCHLPSEVRHHLTLACKEALHNVVKHAGATEAHVELSIGKDGFSIALADNGKGFDPTKVSPDGQPSALRGGRGLANIRHRVEKVGGRLELQSAPGQGTSLRIAVPLSRIQARAAPEQTVHGH